MIEITPAILTNNIDEFKRQLFRLNNFSSVDIDIIRPPYVNNTTIQINQIIPYLKEVKIQSIGFHLMTLDPLNDVDLLLKSNLIELDLRIYFQQETDISRIEYLKWPEKWKRGISIELTSDLESIDFYNNFSDVQFMSIEIGKQGNRFNFTVLKKIDKLITMGYNGKISIDGGINTETVEIIKLHQIDRVSVGSYFSKAEDVFEKYKQLNTILNN